jgi:mannose-1-phosphate guanylyltransferase
MKALILAGGFGTRLRPLTCTRPKPLLPLANTTLIGYILNQLKIAGITEVILATGQNTESLQRVLGDGAQHDIAVQFSAEPYPMGTAGAIKHAKPHLTKNEPILVLNGDIVSDIPYRHLIQYHHQHKATASIALYRVNDPSRFGVVDVRTDGRIQRFVEKPPPDQAPSNLINAGCYVLDYTVLDHIPPNQAVSIEYDIFPNLCRSSSVYGWEHHGLWVDTGTPASFLMAHYAVRTMLKKAPFVGSATRVASNAQIGSDVTIGNQVSIGIQTQITNSIIFDKAIIGDGAIIDSSIIGHGAIIGKNLCLEAYTIVGDGAILDSGATIPPGALICPHYHVKAGFKPPYCFVKTLKSL